MQVLSARFRLLEKLGEGGMGVVYEAEDMARGSRVALKRLRSVDAARLSALKREFRALQGLYHPNILTLYDLFAVGDEWFFTMEVVRGTDFISYVRRSRSADDMMPSKETSGTVDTRTTSRQQPASLDPDSAATASTSTSIRMADGIEPAEPSAAAGSEGCLPTIPRHLVSLDAFLDVGRLRSALAQLSDALHALHVNGLIHRDVKPSNVLVTESGRVVLMDFGIVAEMHSPSYYRSSGMQIAGTPTFMAPEQLWGGQPSPSADWYAFGVMLYLALTGQLPARGSITQLAQIKQQWDPPPPHRITADVPTDLEELCMGLLARDPAQRPDGAEVVARLGARPGVGIQHMLAESTLFVGRSRELGDLAAAYRMVAEGSTLCVLVEGRSGMGKSSLLDRAIDELTSHDPPPIVLAGRCHERESLPYKALDGVVDQLCIHLLDISQQERAELLPEDAALIARLFPVLRRIPEIAELPTAGGQQSNDLRVRAATGLRSLLARLSVRQPLVIRIEDIQWAERDSTELIGDLLSSPGASRLLLLVTRRSESGEPESHGLDKLIGSLADVGKLRRMVLQPLSADEQQELLKRLATHSSGSVHIAHTLQHEAGGHPMLLAELARWAHETPSGLDIKAGIDLEQVLWQRVEHLPAPARALAEAIAIAEESTPLDVLAVAAGLSISEGERATMTLRAERLVQIARMDTYPWIETRHDKVSKAITGHVSVERAVSLHGRVASALESWGNAAPIRLANHWREAGDRVRAASYLVKAAQGAHDQLAFTQATRLYEDVLTLLTDSPSNFPVDYMRCRAWLGLAESLRLTGDAAPSVMLALLDRAQAAAVSHDMVRELVVTHNLRGNLSFARCDFSSCLAEHDKARQLARKADLVEGEARALTGMGDAHLLSGRLLTARGYFDEGVSLCRRHGLVYIEASALCVRGMIRYFENDLAGAIEDSWDARAKAKQTSNARVEVWAQAGMTYHVFSDMERSDDALQCCDAALARAQSAGMQGLAVHCQAARARCLAMAGRKDEALALAEETLADSRQLRYALAAPLLFGVLFLSSDPEKRRRALDEGERILVAGTSAFAHLVFCYDAIEMGLRIGELAVVARYARILEEYTLREPLPWAQLVVAIARALAERASGRRDEELLGVLRQLHDETRSIGLLRIARQIAAAIA